MTIIRYAKLNRVRERNQEILKLSLTERLSNAWFYFESMLFELGFYKSIEGWKQNFGEALKRRQNT